VVHSPDTGEETWAPVFGSRRAKAHKRVPQVIHQVRRSTQKVSKIRTSTKPHVCVAPGDGDGRVIIGSIHGPQYAHQPLSLLVVRRLRGLCIDRRHPPVQSQPPLGAHTSGFRKRQQIDVASSPLPSGSGRWSRSKAPARMTPRTPPYSASPKFCLWPGKRRAIAWYNAPATRCRGCVVCRSPAFVCVVWISQVHP
jgi:hypothetical protein